MSIMRKFLLLTFLSVLCFASTIKAQGVTTQHFTTANGLSNNFVHGIVQDSKGRVWIATESGLNCYDGYQFRVYKSHNSRLKSNWINVLFRDARQRKIWIGVKGAGIYCLDEETGNIVDVTPHKKNINNVIAISPAADGGIWIVCHDMIVHYDYTKEQFSVLVSTRLKESYRNAFDDGKGHLVIAGYYGGLTALNIKDRRPIRITCHACSIDRETANKFWMDPTGKIWIATNYGLRYLKDFILYPSSLFHQVIHDLKECNHQLYAVTDNNINILDTKREQLKSALPITNGWNIYQDDFQNLWIGTHANGVYFIGKGNKPFNFILQQPVWSIIADSNQLWAGGWHKLYRLSHNKVDHTYTLPDASQNVILSLQKEDEKHLLFATDGKLIRFNKQTSYFSEIVSNGQSVPAINFYKDNTGKIWITTSSGIYTLKNGEIRSEQDLNKILGSQVTNCIRIDELGNIWVGTIENGIYVFDKSHCLLKHLTQSKAFFSNSVMHMSSGSNNSLWLATSEGVGYIANAGKSFDCRLYNHEQGLKDPYIRSIREDRDGNVWVSTNNGLSYLNMRTHLFSNFDQNDGLPTSNFTGGLFIAENGMAYTTSLDGIVTFNTHQLTAKRKTSAVNFTRSVVLNASGEQVSENIIQPSAEDGECHLSYNQNDIRITFSVADINQSKQVDYSYKVDNLSEEWTLTDENTITFRSLSPGRYVIRVRARLHGQSWDSASVATMSLNIAHPLWWTLSARLLYLLVIVLVLFVSSRRYKHHLQIKNELELERRKNLAEQENNRERLQFFTNIAHEIRTPLSLIYGPVNELKDKNTLPQECSYQLDIIQKNCNRLMELVNRLMDFRKAETNNRMLVVNKGDLKKCIEETSTNFKQANKNPKVNYLLDLEPTSPTIYFDSDAIKTILSNLLSNAAKYTPKGDIGVSLSQTVREGHQYSCIKVWDTGYGIPQEALPHIFDRYYQAHSTHQASGTGIGLALVKRLCEQHHIRITVESIVDHGTIFTLMLDNEDTYTDALHKEGTNDRKTQTNEKNAKPDATDKTLKTLLVIEDNREISEYIAHSLQGQYNILQAHDGREGLEMAKQQGPDLIICDIMMPVMDGITLTGILKGNLATSHIPVIILTAKTSKEDQQKCYECGAESFVTKPFSINMLKTRISNLLESQQKTAEYVLQKMKEKKTQETEEEKKPKLSKLDQNFINRINEIINQQISSEKLNLILLAEQLKVSQSTLYRKMKALTGVSGNEYIRKMRLNHSLHLMLEAGRNISEAAYESGFVDLAYFRECFKEEYGMTPSEYLKNTDNV